MPARAPSTSASAVTAVEVRTSRPRVVRAFALTFLPIAVLLFQPYACWEGTDFACADEDAVRFDNESGERVIVTPYFLDEGSDDAPLPLVVHGFERGRFHLDVNERRMLELETGDYSYAGSVLEFDDGLARVDRNEVDWDTEPPRVVVHSREHYRLAPRDLREMASITNVARPIAWSFALFVVAPALPFALAAAFVARRRSREDAVDALRGTA